MSQDEGRLLNSAMVMLTASKAISKGVRTSEANRRSRSNSNSKRKREICK